jgi:hypothetical protein
VSYTGAFAESIWSVRRGASPSSFIVVVICVPRLSVLLSGRGRGKGGEHLRFVLMVERGRMKKMDDGVREEYAGRRCGASSGGEGSPDVSGVDEFWIWAGIGDHALRYAR